MCRLVHRRLGAIHAARRVVSGTYPLINPTSKSLHGASITIKVIMCIT